MLRHRDSHRARVYKAEWACELLNVEQAYTPAQAARWLNTFRRSTWARARWPARVLKPIPLTTRDLGEFWGQADADEIWLAPKAYTLPYILIHELAHVLMERHHPGLASHGPEWRRVVLALVRRQFGRRAEAQLSAQLIAHGVPPV